MKKLFFFIFLTSCASSNSFMNSANTNIDFKDNLSFDEFNRLLIEYSKTTPYPDINK